MSDPIGSFPIAGDVVDGGDGSVPSGSSRRRGKSSLWLPTVYDGLTPEQKAPVDRLIVAVRLTERGIA